ncbi:MAG: type II toxin-antitoxin system CcdA family antitoxin [Gammaproteobacteria bacterium]|nr:type II toxin-antitoxin system CcdA family antitoxin [Gammaproteobacteria bacterium]
MRMKQAINLSISKSLVREARAQKINLSRFLEQRLEDHLHKQRAEQWLAENREAIQAYNRRVREFGIFGDTPDRGF